MRETGESTVLFKRALCLFSRVYLTSERGYKKCVKHDQLERIETAPTPDGRIDPKLARSSPDYQFQATHDSVIAPEKPPDRYLWRGGYHITVQSAPDLKICDQRIIVSTWNPGGVEPSVMISLGLTLTDLSGPEPILALIKGFEGRPTDGHAQVITLDHDSHPFPELQAALEHCADELGVVDPKTREPRRTSPRCLSFRVVELDGVPSGMSPSLLHELDENRTDPKCRVADLRILYGLVAGDEGWPYASDDRVRKALARGWGSRGFFWVTALGDGVLLLNEKPRKYGEKADEFFTRWLGVREPYYDTEFNIAGLDHGILYSAERVANIGVRASDVMAQISSMVDARARRAKWPLPSVPVDAVSVIFGRLRSVQLKLLECRENAGRTRVAELGKQYHVLEGDMGLTERLKILDQYALLLDNEVQANRTIWLARLTLLVAFAALIVSFTALFHHT
jgi:hypothetical protein